MDNFPLELRGSILNYIPKDVLYPARRIGINLNTLLDEIEDIGYNPIDFIYTSIQDEKKTINRLRNSSVYPLWFLIKDLRPRSYLTETMGTHGPRSYIGINFDTDESVRVEDIENVLGKSRYFPSINSGPRRTEIIINIDAFAENDPAKDLALLIKRYKKHKLY